MSVCVCTIQPSDHRVREKEFGPFKRIPTFVLPPIKIEEKKNPLLLQLLAVHTSPLGQLNCQSVS